MVSRRTQPRSPPSIPLSGHIQPWRSFPFGVLGVLASWRLNSPAFTHEADGIEFKRTVNPAMADPIRGTAKDAKGAKEIGSLEKVVIGVSIGYALHESSGPAGARPKKAGSGRRKPFCK